MSTPTPTRYPLTWPVGWKRTPDQRREHGHFGRRETRPGRTYPTTEPITITQACKRLLDELQRMGISEDDVVISSDLQLRLDGLPRSGQGEPKDPGAAVYWRDMGQNRCMAIDRYTKVAQNIAALAATIEAMRAIERHGGAAILDRAFTGFTALPPPIAAGMKRNWWLVLLLEDRSPSREQIEAAYRRLAAKYHPDRAPEEERAEYTRRMAEINAARDDAMKELG